MKKNFSSNKDQFDLIDLIQIIFYGKTRIILSVFISFLIGLGYYHLTPKSYFSSIVIKSSQDSKLKKLSILEQLVEIDQEKQEQEINNLVLQDIDKKKVILKRFISEIDDFEEFILILSNFEKVKKSVSNLSIAEQEKKLFNYSRKLELDLNKKETELLITLEWDNIEEAREILQNTIKLVLKNLHESIFKELKESLKFKKMFVKNEDEEILNYLIEQSSIAMELDIEDNRVNSVGLFAPNSLKLNISNVPYYLRGYKAINKEIELINNRDYKNFEFAEKQINLLKNDEIEWVNFNIYSTEVNRAKNIKLILSASISFGLIFGIFYILILNELQNRNTKKKTNKSYF
jgi:LPS O-antigen subunit length determinant protein (WzzB/FepE family)